MGAGDILCPLFSSIMSRFDLLIRTLVVHPTPPRSLRGAGLPFGIRTPHEEAIRLLSPCRGGEPCPDPFSCLWHSSLNRMAHADRETLHRHQKPSPPFAWQLDEGGREDPSLFLHLFGSGALAWENHRRAVESIRISSLPDAALSAVTLTEGCPALDDLVATTPDLPDPLTLDIISPLRLMHEGRPVMKFDPPLFLRSLARRASSLAAWYGEHPIDMDFREISRLCGMVRVVDASLRWERWSHTVQGIVGSVTLSGISRELTPFLILGEYVNAGKGGAWGFGRYLMRRTQ